MSTGTEASAYALLADGTTIEIRPARPGDFDAVRDMHTKMSPDNLYLRFFSFSFSFSAVASEREAHARGQQTGPRCGVSCTRSSASAGLRVSRSALEHGSTAYDTAARAALAAATGTVIARDHLAAVMYCTSYLRCGQPPARA